MEHGRVARPFLYLTKPRVALDKRKGSVKQKVSFSMPEHRDAGQVRRRRPTQEVTRFLNQLAMELTFQPSTQSRVRATRAALHANHLWIRCASARSSGRESQMGLSTSGPPHKTKSQINKYLQITPVKSSL